MKQHGAPLAGLLAKVLRAPGQVWTTRQAAVAAAAKFLTVASSPQAAAGATELAGWCWQLADGLATVSEESRVSQLRQEALEAIRQALMAAGSGGAEAAASGVRGRVLGHAETVLAHDPSAAVKAVAAQVKALVGAGAAGGAAGGDAMDMS